uniref:pre-mRNA splicing regulator USH1G-like n=1 Tax=Myxine glutinosa TaxID=7769 RepID=UPI00358F3EC4
MSNRFHLAARDGNVNLLKETTKKDLNVTDGDGMTPTLLAAECGHIDALQMCIKRGGDADRCDIWGRSALHLAAGNGYLVCVGFLANMGANIWVMDNDHRTPLELASLKGQAECVQLLDKMAGDQTQKDPRQAQRDQDKASKEVEKRIEIAEQLKIKREKQRELLDALDPVVNTRMQHRRSTFSTIRSKVASLSKASGRRPSTKSIANESGANFNSRASITSIALQEDDSFEPPPDSVLVRPGVGNMVFRHCYVPPSLFEAEHGGMVPALAALALGKDRSTLTEVIGMAKEEEVELSDGSPPWNEEGLGLQDDEAETEPLESFLASLSLQESLGACRQQRLDMEALVMCDEDDLRVVGLPVGTRKKLLVAIEKRRQALDQPGPLCDVQL